MAKSLKCSELPFGISCVDTGLHRPELAACYLLEQDGMAGFIDTGVGNNVPGLMDLLKRKSIAPESVAYVMPTHVHLDHAGGAGRLMQELPNARLIMHPRGARHMIDPTRLCSGSMAVYGEERFKQIFGELVPVEADRVIEAADGYELDFNGRKLTFFDTPGHARHHYCIFDELSKGLFTGDTFGASYPALNTGRIPFIFPPTTPVQFDPGTWLVTLDRLMTLEPERIFLTHFGMQENVEVLVRLLKKAINDYVEIAKRYMDVDNPVGEIAGELMALSLNQLQAYNCGLGNKEIERLLAMDMDLNAQGLAHWLANR